MLLSSKSPPRVALSGEHDGAVSLAKLALSTRLVPELWDIVRNSAEEEEEDDEDDDDDDEYDDNVGKTTEEKCRDFKDENREETIFIQRSKSHLDPHFLARVPPNSLDAFKWVLHALSLLQTKKEVVPIWLMDIIFFNDGIPQEWYYSNESGSIRRLTEGGEESLRKYMKKVHKMVDIAPIMLNAEVITNSKRPVCYKWQKQLDKEKTVPVYSVECAEIIRSDPRGSNRLGLCALQMAIRPKAGYKDRGYFSLIYVQEYTETNLGRSVVSTMKKYDKSEHLKPVNVDALTISQRRKLENVDHTVYVKNLDMELHERMENVTYRIVRYLEAAYDLKVVLFRAEYVVDESNKIWLVRTRHVQVEPKTLNIPKQLTASSSSGNISDTEKMLRLRKREAEDSLLVSAIAALQKIPARRDDQDVLSIFSETRSARFFRQFTTQLHKEFCRLMKIVRMNASIKVFKDVQDACLFFILSGSVRMTHSDQRQFVLVNRDVFGESFLINALTADSEGFHGCAETLEETELIILTRNDYVCACKNMQAPVDSWGLRHVLVDKCIAILQKKPHHRNENDVRTLVNSTVNSSFFLGIPERVHWALCTVAPLVKVTAATDIPCLRDPTYVVVLSGKFEVVIAIQQSTMSDAVVFTKRQHFVSNIDTVVRVDESSCNVLMFTKALYDSALIGAEPKDHQREHPLTYQKKFYTPVSEPTILVDYHAEPKVDSHLKIDWESDEMVAAQSLWKRLRKERKKMTTCRVCGKINDDDEQWLLTLKMIRDTVKHLKARGVTNRIFEKAAHSHDDHSLTFVYAELTVCHNCYHVYLNEKNLEDQENIFARAVLSAEMAKKSIQVLRSGKIEEYAQQVQDTLAMCPSRMLTLACMFIEFQEFEDITLLRTKGRNYSLVLNFAGIPVTVGVDLELAQGGTGGTVNLEQLRCFWYFSTTEMIRKFLETQENVRISLITEKNDEIGFCEFPFASVAQRIVFRKTFTERVKPTKPENAYIMAHLALTVNFGVLQMQQLETKHLRLRQFEGLYFPYEPYITEVLPADGWSPYNEEKIMEALMGKMGSIADSSVVSASGRLIPSGIPTHIPTPVASRPQSACTNGGHSSSASSSRPGSAANVDKKKKGKKKGTILSPSPSPPPRQRPVSGKKKPGKKRPASAADAESKTQPPVAPKIVRPFSATAIDETRSSRPIPMRPWSASSSGDVRSVMFRPQSGESASSKLRPSSALSMSSVDNDFGTVTSEGGHSTLEGLAMTLGIIEDTETDELSEWDSPQYRPTKQQHVKRSEKRETNPNLDQIISKETASIAENKLRINNAKEFIKMKKKSNSASSNNNNNDSDHKSTLYKSLLNDSDAISTVYSGNGKKSSIAGHQDMLDIVGAMTRPATAVGTRTNQKPTMPSSLRLLRRAPYDFEEEHYHWKWCDAITNITTLDDDLRELALREKLVARREPMH